MRYWVVIAAAGSGRRFGDVLPKQYARLGARRVIDWSVDFFLSDERCRGLALVLSAGDTLWSASPSTWSGSPRLILASGGAQRSDSVFSGLRALPAAADDWVLVHDAARPCLAAADLARLIEQGGTDEHGGLLAAPVSDTVKRGSAGRVAQTVERADLWRALTPQFFRIDVLLRALEQFGGAGDVPDGITDESSAVERLGLRPRLIAGDAANIKVTAPGDLRVAEAYLRLQGNW